MSALWSSADIAKATGGKSVGQWQAGELSIDTRTIRQGEIFVPLKDIRDGHEFIPMAFEKGAAGVLSEREIADVPAVRVKDTMQALELMAVFARKRSQAKRIAVTGSVGKTSVKEMLAHILSGFGKTHKSIKSFNNHWGVPVTLANMQPATKYGVFEAGMNHKGELENLSKIIKPDIAIITKIAPAHLAHFDSVADIARAKAEIFSHLADGGIIILPADSDHFDLLYGLAKSRKATILTFGEAEKSDARIIDCNFTASNSRARLNIFGEEINLHLPLAGRHWVENSAIALLLVKSIGLDLSLASKALLEMPEIQGRGQEIRLDIDGKKINLLDESYNANPESMRAAILVLGLKPERRVAILGDMLELGDSADSLHAELAGYIIKNDINQVISCGKLMQNLHNALPENISKYWFENIEECAENINSIIKHNDTIMLKGSNASGVGKLVAILKSKSKTRGKKADAV